MKTKYLSLPKEAQKNYDKSVVIANPKAVPPYMEVQDGFGYQGIILENTHTNQIQCHICGKWFVRITGAHIRKHAKQNQVDFVDTDGYREKFGFLKSTPLWATVSRLQQSDMSSSPHNVARMSKLRAQYYRKGLTGMAKAHKNLSVADSMNSAEYRNKLGTCDAQIIKRVKDFVKANKRTPSNKEMGGLRDIAQYRFGGWNKLLERAGFSGALNNKHYTDDELVDAFRRFVHRTGRLPRGYEYARKNLPSKSTYQLRIGGIREVCDRALLDYKKLGGKLK